MKVEKVALNKTGYFAPLFLDYLKKKDHLTPFYQQFPEVTNFAAQMEQKKLPEHTRVILSHVLETQYGPLKITDAVDFNIHALKNENTFTVTTGHQLNIFTGPLYFIYKIISVINTCQKLKAAYPEKHFVPVYWMASEDHDKEEINHFHLFGKTYRWETPQEGPVGRFSPHSLNDLIHQMPEAVQLFEQAYLDHDTLADAVRFYMNQLFGKYGLVVLDADHPELKALFSRQIQEEVLNQSCNPLVDQTNQELTGLGYKAQAFSREINFFYMEGNLRERLVREGDQFKVLHTDLAFSVEEIQDLIRNEPEKFSPNVITRPLYQETILPNLAYCGGPAEIAYWLQLKRVFDHHQTLFPILLPRSFAMILNKANHKKLKKTNLKVSHLFKNTHDLKEKYLSKHNANGHMMESERRELISFFERLKQKAIKVDQSLEGFVGAESAKTFKILDEISRRIKKAEEQLNETALQQIDSLKEKLFPEGNLQERYDNFLNFYLNHQEILEVFQKKFDPFDFRFNVLLDEL